MNTRLFHSFFTAALLVLIATPLLHAKQVKFPIDDPAFTFTMPDTWTTETGKDGRIYCTAPDGFKIGIIASPGLSDADDAKALLPKILKGMADSLKCQNYKAKDAKAGDLGKLSLNSMRAQCKSEGVEMTLSAVVFSLKSGKYFSLVGAAPAVLDKVHDKEMNDLIKSITAVE
jgi:hypothetical protein